MYSPEYSLTVMDNSSPNIVYVFVIIGLLVAYPSAGVNGLLGFAAFCIVMLGIFKWSRMMVFNKYNIWANHVFATYGNSYLEHITRKQFDNYILSHIQSRKSREKTKQISWADRKKIWFENYSSGYAFFAMIFGILSVTIILSPFALLFGILGLIQSKRRNEASGVKRSLFGIVMGIIFLVILIHNIIF